jgi:hypothetical protein
MFEILKTESFSIAFSALLGFAIVMIFYPACKDGCRVRKAPPIDEIKNSTYQLADKCYQFQAHSVNCPPKGTIEAFGVVNGF